MLWEMFYHVSYFCGLRGGVTLILLEQIYSDETEIWHIQIKVDPAKKDKNNPCQSNKRSGEKERFKCAVNSTVPGHVATVLN